ncbi:transmembrane and ubiquitin-like domain-containing protein 1 [Protopterus annectens]|uniref:transmembrane and ubiquitin-like domain-containing protein 1 n=1 Tax=Protopterus annectens TaxID=7888 RepID=UPI001CFB32A3|nr:transmembrane and ubiquitin-like domain-containing protein 1 [Protopterus annectens]XP_043923525.1 transmembrane and ubiquitin-like domain-containing protein 1 [Protopterus annectens]XP_043923526.1 transmembrane and ubiquitin-like domain-containing protein 1 [Protopterus annectens]
MTIIEGVGDEVTILFGCMFIFLVLILAWISTHTVDRSEQLFASVVGAVSHSSVPHEESAQDAGTDGEIQPDEGDSSHDADGEKSSSNNDNLATETSSTESDLRHRVTLLSHVEPNISSLHQEPEVSQPPLSNSEERRMVLRLKFLNDTEKMARIKPNDTVGYLKRTYFPGQEHQVRLIYQGQLLREDSQTMSSLHLKDNSVIHCHVSQHATPQMPAGTQSAEQVHAALNIGSLMVPLFVLMLAVLWYCQFQYRQLFTATATVSLAGFTLLVSLVAFSMYRR